MTIIDTARHLRNTSTEAEKKLWARLRNRQLNGAKFRRQHPLPPYVADFFCEDAKLVIELDGSQHTPENDAQRTKFLENKGYTVLRFWNNDLTNNMQGVLEQILAHLPSPETPGEGVSTSPKGELKKHDESTSSLPLPMGEVKPRPSRGLGEGKSRIPIAKIATAHGVRGLVKLIVHSNDPARIDGIPLYISEHSRETLTLRLKNPAGRAWIASVDGITDRTAAETLRHITLWVDRETLPDTQENEYYAADLVGMSAHDSQGALVGTVIAVSDFGASPLLEIKPQSKPSFYLPFTNECVPAVDIAGKKLTVSVPEGLL